MKDQKQDCCTPLAVDQGGCCVEVALPLAGCCGPSTEARCGDHGQPGGASSCSAGPTSISACCDDASAVQPRSLTDRLRQLRSAWTLVVLIPVLHWLLAPEQLGEFLTISSSALAGTAPYILFAVLLIAWLKASGAESLVANAFVGRENRMILLAALFGGLAPFCSCEVIPFIAGLLALGAPVSAVMAFWLSSPLIDPPSLLITAGALGWEFAVGKAAAAVALGLLGGFGVKLLMARPVFASPLKSDAAPACSSGQCGGGEMPTGHARWAFWQHTDARQTFGREARENALFLFKWLTLAYLLEGLLIMYVPAEMIGGVVGGDGLGSVMIGALVGMPAYLNSYAAPPLVAGLMEQGMSAGSAMAFMVAGAISSIPAMTAVWSLVRKPVFAAYIGFGLAGAILFGSVFGLVVGSV